MHVAMAEGGFYQDGPPGMALTETPGFPEPIASMGDHNTPLNEPPKVVDFAAG